MQEKINLGLENIYLKGYQTPNDSGNNICLIGFYEVILN